VKTDSHSIFEKKSKMTATNEPCPFAGNSDIYGVGVRIGLYSQWVATLLVTLFNPEDEEMFRIVNLIIQASIFLGIAQQSSSETNAVEPIIVLFLMCGSLSSLTGNGMRHFSHVSGVIRALFYAALSAYGCWFWFEGLDKMMRPGCSAIAFFGRSSVDGWFRTLAKALSVFGLILSVFLTGVCIFAIVRRFYKEFDDAVKRPRKQRPQVEIGLLVLSAGLIAFSVIVVEYLIRVNHVTGLSTIDAVGQLIPFLIGIMECTSISWKILVKGLFLRKRCWFLFGKHL
jgi:hypothetical protein